jgi:hypothetical protein
MHVLYIGNCSLRSLADMLVMCTVIPQIFCGSATHMLLGKVSVHCGCVPENKA